MAKAMKSMKAVKVAAKAPQSSKYQKDLVKKLRQRIRRMRCMKMVAKKKYAELKDMFIGLKEEIAFLEMCLELYYQLIPTSIKQSIMEEASRIPDAE